MRIAVICGSLSPGKDGVGDYARCLVGAADPENEYLLISLRDSDKAQESNGHIQVQRFRNALYRPDAASNAIRAIKDFEPNLISLQFVPFAFSPKGIIRNLLPIMDEIVGTCPMHIMFHELWLGEKPSLPVKHKLLGLAQKRLIRRALDSWEPALMHTSNTLYLDVLQRNGYTAKILPLFGNIPIEAVDGSRLKTALPWYPARSDERIVLFPFSQSLTWRSRRVMEILIEAASMAQVSLRLIQVGKNAYAEQHWPRIKSTAKQQGWTCNTLGPCSASKLSQLMHAADVGISSAHLQLAGKSGAIIGMLEHGLPVICTSWEVESKHEVSPMDSLSGLYSLEQPIETIAELLKNPPKGTVQARLSQIADQWVKDLEALV